MNKRDFIAQYMIHRDGAPEKLVEQALLAWGYVVEVAPTPRTEKARGAKKDLTAEQWKEVGAIHEKWQKTPGIKKNRTVKGDVAAAFRKLGDSIPFEAIKKGANNYLEYMVETGQVAYIKGLQVWINERQWEDWQDDKKEAAKADNELMRLRQDLAHAKKMGWPTEELEQKIRERQNGTS